MTEKGFRVMRLWTTSADLMCLCLEAHVKHKCRQWPEFHVDAKSLLVSSCGKQS